jgi:hypothetical protein
MAQSSKSTRSAAESFIEVARGVTATRTATEFFEALKEGYLALHGPLTRDPDGVQASALRQAFGMTQADPAVRLALEFCAFPIYEKPILPMVSEDSTPEFLWIFALPVVIRFPDVVRQEGAYVWDHSPLPAEDMLQVLGDSGRFEQAARLRMFTNLYTRSDIFAWGPENLALHVLNAEISESEAPMPMPLPVQFSEELSGYRSMMFMALCAARVPVTVKRLIQQRQGREDLDLLEKLIAKNLETLGLPYESVTVAPPCPLTASCFISNPAFLQQVSEICMTSQEMWDLKSVYVKFPMPGYVELAGRLEDDSEVVLMPAELCCEPRKEVASLLERVVAEAGLPVGGSFVGVHNRVSQLH